MSINYLDKTGLEHIGDIENYKKRNIDYTTYTGTDLEIEDTLENKINFNNLYGQTKQDSYEGKNLFNKNSVELGKIVSRTDGTLSNAANYNASDYIPMKENTTYTLTALNFNRWYSACYDENKNYIGYVENEATFTTISGTKYMRFTVYNDLMDTAMIVEGTELPDYEPYVGGTASPNPDYPQEIKTVTGRQVVKITGKNLFSSEIELGNITGTGTKEDSTTRCRTKDFISIKPNTTYSLWNNKSQTYNLYFYDENKTYLSYLYVSGNSFTAPANAKYIMFLFGNVVLDILVMLNEGSTALPYEPYKEQSYELNLGKNLFNKDNINEVRGTINVTSSIFTYSSTSVNYCFYIPCKPNTTYTIQKRNDGDVNRFKFASCSTPISTEESGVTTITTGVSNDSASSLTITTGPDDIYIIAQYYRSEETKLTKQQLLDSIQLEKGEEATPYSPYFTPIELCEIGDYQDSIKKSTGKNLFGLNSSGTDNGINYNYTNGVLTLNGTSTTNSGNYFNGEITLPPGTYTISFNLNKTPGVTFGYYLRDKNNMSTSIVDSGNLNAANASNYKTFTLSEEKTLVSNVFIPSGSSVSDLKMNIQLEQGNTSTDYEPYGVGKWYVEKKIGKAVLDGSEEWIYISSNDFYFTTGYGTNYSNSSTNIISDKLLGVARDDISGKSNYITIIQNGNLRINYSGITNVATLKSTLSNSNINYYYVLATSTAEEITDEELIEQLNDLYDAFYMNSKTYINVEGDLPIVLEINHDKPRFLNLIDKGELQKYIIDLEKRVAILESQITE